MREIVVVSGKGGTGKTSVSASLAVLASPVVVVDCDVDAADTHMLLTPSPGRENAFLSGHMAVIDPGACTACGKCLELCRFDAVSGDTSGIYQIDPVGCEGCGVCARFCPSGAILMEERNCGVWMVSSARTGPLVHARLAPAAENSGRLVSLVRTEARRIASEKGLETVICDGPPGIGCPVIASVTGASMILAVTEPSLSALHDLERVLSLAAHFSVPSAVCINKHDINPDITERIESAMKERGVPVAGRIGYDPGFTRSLLTGMTVVETDSPTAAEIVRLWEELLSIGDSGDG